LTHHNSNLKGSPQPSESGNPEYSPDRNLTKRFRSLLGSLLQLTKPTIMLLVIMGGMTAVAIEGSLLNDPLKLSLFMLGLFLTGGSANALNQYFERHLDGRMSRTKNRRPLPLGYLSPLAALIFSVTIGLTGVVLLGWIFNWLTGMLSLATILFYSLFYTLYLKPRTDQNIVIGGIAGAMAPIGAWTAATGSISAIALIIFAIIFLWTPPHFWALAIFCRDDYRRVGLPMLPVVKGVRNTFRQIFYYTLILVAVSLLPLIFGAGIIYGAAAAGLGFHYIRLAWRALDKGDDSLARKLFFYSLLYLPGVFAALVVDHFMPY